MRVVVLLLRKNPALSGVVETHIVRLNAGTATPRPSMRAAEGYGRRSYSFYVVIDIGKTLLA